MDRQTARSLHISDGSQHLEESAVLCCVCCCCSPNLIWYGLSDPRLSLMTSWNASFLAIVTSGLGRQRQQQYLSVSLFPNPVFEALREREREGTCTEDSVMAGEHLKSTSLIT